jgi:pimeloyl-ACP methyl ester carboxylesterase
MPLLDCGDVQIRYDLRGTGPPVLFIQGVGIHRDGWRPQMDALAADFACASFDNRGIGQSSAARSVTVDDMARDALAVMDTCGWPSAHLVGHSLGGLVALRIALDAPRRVRSLALLCTFARGADAGRSARMIWLGTRSRVGTRRMRRRAFLEMVLPAADVGPADADRLASELAPLFGHDLADHPPIETAQLSAMRRVDVTAELHRIVKTPTLVVSASHDPIAPPALGRRIADGIPGARYELLEDASHGAPIQRAARVNALLRDHLTAAESSAALT